MIKFICDFTLEESRGGAEFVDNTVIEYLGVKVTKSSELIPSKDEFYILSNTSLMKQENLDFIRDNCKYIILEHDYKIHPTRHPWRFENGVVPSDQITNRDLYKNALATFVQTDDHLQVFKLNGIEGNFESLECSIWSDKELDTLSKFCNNNPRKRSTFAVLDSQNWIKNTKQAVDFCENMKIDYELVGHQDYDIFLQSLAAYSTLVFFPIARETCCRLLVEAKCLGLNVITSGNSGAFQSDWFRLNKLELINYLKDQSKKNLKNIEGIINESTTTDR